MIFVKEKRVSIKFRGESIRVLTGRGNQPLLHLVSCLQIWWRLNCAKISDCILEQFKMLQLTYARFSPGQAEEAPRESSLANLVGIIFIIVTGCVTLITWSFGRWANIGEVRHTDGEKNQNLIQTNAGSRGIRQLSALAFQVFTKRNHN